MYSGRVRHDKGLPERHNVKAVWDAPMRGTMTEYNLLTKRLLEEGYTETNHPDYVVVGSGSFGNNKLDNLDGGFKYYRWYVYDKTYKTPCGIQCKGNFAHCGLSWLGKEYNYENDNPYILCPKDEPDCKLRDEPFRSKGTGVLKFHCPVHMVEEKYHYDGSCEEARHLWDDKIRREKTSFILEKNGHVCEEHMDFDRESHVWKFRYNPMACSKGYCRAQTSDFKDGGYCPVLNKRISREKGNVFYDIEYSGRDYSKDGTFFEGERFKTIIKGRQLFEKPIRLDIARVIANLCKDEISSRARWNSRDYDALTMFRAERGEIDFHWKVLNIRAEKRIVRDLEQDLNDIENGITVVHERERLKGKKEEKRAKRAEAQQKAIKKLEKLILKDGYGELSYSDQNRAIKLIGAERIDELEAEREEAMKNPKKEPEQMSIFDFIGGTL